MEGHREGEPEHQERKSAKDCSVAWLGIHPTMDA
jgi:hypothetical protein